jgi:hypothetical protein
MKFGLDQKRRPGLKNTAARKFELSRLLLREANLCDQLGNESNYISTWIKKL